MNSGLVKITLLDSCRKSEFRRPTRRLIEACKRQHLSFHERHIQQDIFAEYEAIAAWGIVTCCYSGIEQAMKCLLKMRNTFVEKGLCKACYRRFHGNGNTRCEGSEKCGNREPYSELFLARHDFVQTLGKDRNHKHHLIGKLFGALAREEQDVLRESYTVYRSLHDYISPETVDCFLNEIDDGYPSWRYFLLEDKMPPTTHPGAMLEVWSALTNILQARVFSNHGLETVATRIIISLNRKLQRGPYEHFDLNKCIDLFLKLAERKTDSDDIQGPDDKELSTLLEDVEKYLRDDIKEEWVDNDLVYFIYRASRGEMIWDTVTKLFKKVSRLEEINIKFVVSEHPNFETFIVGPSVVVARLESVPAHVRDFTFRARPEVGRTDAEWTTDVEVEKEVAECDEKVAEIEEYEGGVDLEAYTCLVGKTRLVLVLSNSEDWIVYEYHNDNVLGIPPHCKRISGNLSTLREAIREIERWRSTQPEELEAYRLNLWRRRGKKVGKVRSSK